MIEGFSPFMVLWASQLALVRCLPMQETKDTGFIPESGGAPGEGDGNPLQYSCLENPTDGEAWQATVQGVAKSRTRLTNFIFTFFSFMLQMCFLSIYIKGK